jgi:hypothetical protein
MRFGFEASPMKNKTILILFAIYSLTGISVVGYGNELFVIAHSGVTLAADDIHDVFIGDKQFAGAQKLILTDNVSAQGAFLGKVLKMELKRYYAMWVKKSFREGLAIPTVKGSDAEVIAFVKNNPGTIGYVSTVPAGVKTLAKFP